MRLTPSRTLYACCLLISLSLAGSWARADDSSDQQSYQTERQSLNNDWKLIHHDRRRHIEFYLRKDSNYRVSVNKMVTIFDAPLASIVAACMDVDHMGQWIWHLSSATLLKQESPNDLIIHLVISSPYGIEDRDAVIHTHIAQDSKTHVVTLTTESVDGYIAPGPGLVRMAKLQMNWRFTPRSDWRVDAEMVGIIDPGGRIPAWTANIIQHSSLYYSLKNLMRISQNERYSNPALPFPIVQ